MLETKPRSFYYELTPKCSSSPDGSFSSASDGDKPFTSPRRRSDPDKSICVPVQQNPGPFPIAANYPEFASGSFRARRRLLRGWYTAGASSSRLRKVVLIFRFGISEGRGSKEPGNVPRRGRAIQKRHASSLRRDSLALPGSFPFRIRSAEPLFESH